MKRSFDDVFVFFFSFEKDFLFLIEYAPEEGWRLDALNVLIKGCVYNIKYMKEFKHPNNIWNVNDSFQSYK